MSHLQAANCNWWYFPIIHIRESRTATMHTLRSGLCHAPVSLCNFHNNPSHWRQAWSESLYQTGPLQVTTHTYTRRRTNADILAGFWCWSVVKFLSLTAGYRLPSNTPPPPKKQKTCHTRTHGRHFLLEPILSAFTLALSRFFFHYTHTDTCEHTQSKAWLKKIIRFRNLKAIFWLYESKNT